MNTLILLLVSLLIAGLVTWRLLTGSTHEKRHEKKAAVSLTPLSDKAPRREFGDNRNYSSVSLKICTKPCKAALAIRNKPMLLADAPKLPLTGCDRACQCELVPHSDRRLRPDRRSPAQDHIKVASHAAAEEHRAGRDRRRARNYTYKGLS